MQNEEGKELTTLNECWEDLDTCFPEDMPSMMRYQLKQSFFTGAWALLQLQNEIASSKEGVRKRLKILFKELDATVDELDAIGAAHVEAVRHQGRPH